MPANSSAQFIVPEHLASHQAQGLKVGEPIAQFELGNLKNFVYLVIDWKQKRAFVVDTQLPLAPLQEALNQYCLELEGILLTHSHHDHVAGLRAMIEAYPSIQAWIHPADQFRIHGIDSTRIRPLHHKEFIWSDDETSLQAFHTPGHSPGETSFYFKSKGRGYLLTGDTLFIRDCGRTDFEGGSNEDMFRSLQWMKSLPNDTVILPGHHYQKETASTLEREKSENAPLKCQSVEELKALP